MISFEELINDEHVKAEYKKAVLLSLFKKVISKKKNDSLYRIRIDNLFKESFNRVRTIQIILKNDFGCEIDEEDAAIMNDWFLANERKKSTRNSMSLELKKELCKKQNGRCVCCGKKFSDDYSSIHVDHVIPWVLVGDELKNNYQALCEVCNESKSSRTDYMISKLLKII